MNKLLLVASVICAWISATSAQVPRTGERAGCISLVSRSGGAVCADRGCSAIGGKCSDNGKNCFCQTEFDIQSETPVKSTIRNLPTFASDACITVMSTSGGWQCQDRSCSANGGFCVDSGRSCACKTSAMLLQEEKLEQENYRNRHAKMVESSFPQDACITVIMPSGGWACQDKGCAANGGRCNGSGDQCVCEPTAAAVQAPILKNNKKYADDACITVMSTSGGWFCQDRSCSANGGTCAETGNKCICK